MAKLTNEQLLEIAISIAKFVDKEIGGRYVIRIWNVTDFTEKEKATIDQSGRLHSFRDKHFHSRTTIHQQVLDYWNKSIIMNVSIGKDETESLISTSIKKITHDEFRNLDLVESIRKIENFVEEIDSIRFGEIEGIRGNKIFRYRKYSSIYSLEIKETLYMI